MRRVSALALVLLPLAACAAAAPQGPPLLHRPGAMLVLPPAEALANADGSPRVTDAAAYARFGAEVAPLLERWAADARLGISPAFVAALLAKESGFEPFAMSGTPAIGYPQLTPPVDVELRTVAADHAGWAWMGEEMAPWPRHPAVHGGGATREGLLRRIEAGELTASTEYFFDPVRSTRAAVFWLRRLVAAWTEDEWPGMYGALARERLADGGALPEARLFELVVVSYNQGYPYVAALVERHGSEWTAHLNPEAADYLDRLGVYARLFLGP